jgi:hypothetical protein
MKKNKKDLIIRNSTAEFLIFSTQAKSNGIEVRYEDENLWLTQKMMAELFQVTSQNITLHLQSIYKEHELDEGATCKDFLQVQKEGSREVNRKVKFYNLDAVISVGYRVNSKRATEFRQWSTRVLKDFSVKGFVIDRKRLENGAFLGEDYFEHLLEEIREIRLSERRFYQKVTDIYATSVDYNSKSEITIEFFRKVQNKMHFAIHGQTAAEVIVNRANHERQNMGLTSWENAPSGKIVKLDVSVAKNYLTQEELDGLGRLVNAYLDLAERQANRKIPMSMNDWSIRLDKFLEMDGSEILKNAGKVTAHFAKEFAESQFEKYRITQDQLFESDFDKLVNTTKPRIEHKLEKTVTIKKVVKAKANKKK